MVFIGDGRAGSAAAFMPAALNSLPGCIQYLHLSRAACCLAGEGRVHACLREHRRELSDACRREEMILEQQEAEHIELRPNLLKACADERQAFCAGVAPGSARVFR